MQDLLISKQGEEQVVGQQIQAQKATSNSLPANIVDLTDDNLSTAATKPLNLKNVILQRDDLQERLKCAMKELDTLRSQKS